jgi:3-oxoacyl-[acyl-carrier protein] reductase
MNTTKYAVITGSTKGIGREIGLTLLAKGYYVIFNYSNSDIDALKLEDQIKNEHKNSFSIIKKDLSNPDSVEPFVSDILKITSSLDVLVFNAGITDRSKFDEITMDGWMKVFNTNLNVPFFILKSLKPYIIKNGNVIFIGSRLGNTPHSVSLSYGISKSAIHSLVKNLVKFFADSGIRINGIAPGFVDTDWQKSKSEIIKKNILGKIALHRFCTVEELSKLTYHIIENGYINGEVIQLDGGYNFE